MFLGLSEKFLCCGFQFRPVVSPIVRAQLLAGDFASRGLLDCYAAFRRDRATTRNPLANSRRAHPERTSKSGLTAENLTGFCRD